MATRIVTFLNPEGPASPIQFEFEGTRGAETRNHLAALTGRCEGPCTVLTLGTLEARARWFAEGALASGWAAEAPRVGFRELLAGKSDGERWGSFTTLATALAEAPLSFDLLAGGPMTEAQAPSQILLDITYATHEVPFLAASVVTFLQHQRRRNNAAGLALRVVHAAPADAAGVRVFSELTQLLHVLSWESSAGPPRSGLTPAEPISRDKLGGWVRRAKTIPAVPWAQGPKPRALNLTGHPTSTWGPAEREAAAALGLTPIDFPASLALDPLAPLSEVEALADRSAALVLDDQPTAVLLDTEPTLALALVARLQRAGVRCFSLVRRAGAFASWREFPSLGLSLASPPQADRFPLSWPPGGWSRWGSDVLGFYDARRAPRRSSPWARPSRAPLISTPRARLRPPRPPSAKRCSRPCATASAPAP